MDKNEVTSSFREGIEERFQQGYDSYLEEKGIPDKFVPNNAVSNVVDEQVNLGFDDFWDEVKADISEDDYQDQISDYIKENYDDDFVTMQFEKEIDEDQIETDLKDDLILFLINTEPYGNLSRGYWTDHVNQVDSIKELGEYDNEDGLQEFVMKYAPDWQEEAEENQEPE